MYGEEYLPTNFKDSAGREYTVHITVRTASELCRMHRLGLQDLVSGPAMPFHVLLDAAEIGTRYQSRAKDQSREEFLDSLGDEAAFDATLAAGNALVNFFLRSQKIPAEQARIIAVHHAGSLDRAREAIRTGIMNLAGGGETCGDSPA